MRRKIKMYNKKGISKKTIIVIIAVVLIGAGILFGIFGTQSGKRAVKSFFSDFGGGLDRTMTVYEYNGKEIAKYEGKMDIQYEDNRVLFDDENGKRHQIVGGIVIVDEK